MNPWASRWKMTFNSDSNKQEQEVIFFSKYKEDITPSTEL